MAAIKQSTAPIENSVFVLGISGPSSAGKTTLARLLARVFAPHVKLILHGDDFCRDIKLIPIINGYPDADGPSGVDFEKLKNTLNFVRSSGGKLPESFRGWYDDAFPDQEEKALDMVPPDTLQQLQDHVLQQLGDAKYSIVIIEGFLMYHRSDILKTMDSKLFLRLSHEEAKRRRFARPSYEAAKEGEFWKTEDYFEQMVWRNYVEQHADLFEDGDVENKVNTAVSDERGIAVQEEIDVEPRETLRWAVDVVISSLRSRLGLRSQSETQT
ncbi:MAG: ribosylnicotinamide kinase [Bogoriella megaspora]|nr:MAG: ribosylnicotinamide kinase [Bogoriella megaspora]